MKKKLNLKKFEISKLTVNNLMQIKGKQNQSDACKTECRDAACNTEHFACQADTPGSPSM